MAKPEKKGSHCFPRAPRALPSTTKTLCVPQRQNRAKVSTRTPCVHLHVASALLFQGQEKSWSYFNFGLVCMGKLIQSSTVQQSPVAWFTPVWEQSFCRIQTPLDIQSLFYEIIALCPAGRPLQTALHNPWRAPGAQRG